MLPPVSQSFAAPPDHPHGNAPGQGQEAKVPQPGDKRKAAPELPVASVLAAAPPSAKVFAASLVLQAKRLKLDEPLATDPAMAASIIRNLGLQSTPEVQRTPLERALLKNDWKAVRERLEQASGMPLTRQNIPAMWAHANEHSLPERVFALLALIGYDEIEELHRAEGNAKLIHRDDYAPVLHRAFKFRHQGLNSFLKQYAYPSKHAVAMAPNGSAEFSGIGKKILCAPESVYWAICRAMYHNQRLKFLQNRQPAEIGNVQKMPRFSKDAFSPVNLTANIRISMEKAAEILLRVSPSICIFDYRQMDDFSKRQFHLLDNRQLLMKNPSPEAIELYGLFTPEHALSMEFKIKTHPSNKNYIRPVHDPNNPFLHYRQKAAMPEKATWSLELSLPGTQRLVQYAISDDAGDASHYVMAALYPLDIIEQLAELPEACLDRLQENSMDAGLSEARHVELPPGQEKFSPAVIGYMLIANLVRQWHDMQPELNQHTEAMSDDQVTDLFRANTRHIGSVVLSLCNPCSPILQPYLDTVLSLPGRGSKVKLDIAGTPDASGDTAMVCADADGTKALLDFLDRIADAGIEETLGFVTNTRHAGAEPVFNNTNTSPEKITCIMRYIDRQPATMEQKCAAIVNSGYLQMLMDSDLNGEDETTSLLEKLLPVLSMHSISLDKKKELLIRFKDAFSVLADDDLALLADDFSSDDERSEAGR
jgi:hypothetical protein